LEIGSRRLEVGSWELLNRNGKLFAETDPSTLTINFPEPTSHFQLSTSNFPLLPPNLYADGAARRH
jgi:hypothetical protein